MAKRKTTQPITDDTPDFLTKSKKQFEKEIIERIKIGEELFNRGILNNTGLRKLREEYNFWHDFNAELLKRAFNKTTNQYYKDYTSTPSIFVRSMIPHQPSFSEMLGKAQADVSKHLTRLKKIKGKIILMDESPGLQSKVSEDDADLQSEGLIHLDRLFAKFHKVAQSLRHRHSNRETILLNDEYDVQDLLCGLLQIKFSDIREEEYSPSYAGANSRIDFILKEEKIVIETKMTNESLTDKEVGSQLLIDIGRYRSHPDCEVLVVFIYDKGDHIRNKRGMINDLEKMGSSGLKVKVFINPY